MMVVVPHKGRQRLGRLLTISLLAVCGLPAVVGAFAPIPLQSQRQARTNAPRVFSIDGEKLAETKRAIIAGDKTHDQALAALASEARKALETGPFSVVTKGKAPPSGDAHDYMSQAPYFWPDPRKPNGLPYVRRDGERNPEIENLPDHQNMNRMIAAVSTLALAYYFNGDEVYASRASKLLRVWFLDAATRMNPNLEYAQAIPGVNTGRGIGLIETRGLTQVVDAVGLLAGSKAWTDADQKGMERWFGQYLSWLMESAHGRDEAAARNNHGTFYDVQVASFALFVDRKEVASEILKASREKRIARQVEPDGRQPLELDRTRSWGYSVMNLQGLIALAELGDCVGLDLWSYSTSDGRSIRRALEYLVPFSLGDQKWPGPQIGEWSPQSLFPLLRKAATRYRDSRFRALASKVPSADPADRSSLFEPKTIDKDALR